MTKFILPEIEFSPAINYPNFLESLNDDQRQILNDIENTYRQDQFAAALKAQAVLKAFPWPTNYSSKALNFKIFATDKKIGVSGDIAFYYYIFDKCIPRGSRNPDLNFMDRIATFLSASIREHSEVSSKWILRTPAGDIPATLAFDPNSGDHGVLLPKPGERAPDFKLTFDYNGNTYTWGVEEKPCISVDGAIKKYSNNHKDLHGADKLMLALEKSYGSYKAGYYLHNYKTGITIQMIPIN